jgi:hypothetical protein
MKNVLKQRGIDVFSASSSEAHGRTRIKETTLINSIEQRNK